MSTAVRSVSARQRANAAAIQLREVLGLEDRNLLGYAVIEAAAREVTRNDAFAASVRRLYAELASRPTSRSSVARSRVPEVELVPLAGSEGVRVDPFAPLDAFLLHRIYGSAQLKDALEVYSLAKLKEASAIVERRFPGTKPTNRARKDSIIAYIVEKVTGSPQAQHD